MARPWNPKEFDTFWERFICQDELNFGGRDYYLRYHSRYLVPRFRDNLLAIAYAPVNSK